MIAVCTQIRECRVMGNERKASSSNIHQGGLEAEAEATCSVMETLVTLW